MTDVIEAEAVELATVAEANERAAQIRQGIVNYTETLGLVAEAYQHGDWRVLGHDSWDAYVDAEFGETRLKLTGDIRKQAIEALRISGLSGRAIGAVLGINQSTVSRELGSGDANASPAVVTGTDGKSYSPAQPERPAPATSDAPAVDVMAGRAYPAPQPPAPKPWNRPASEPDSAPVSGITNPAPRPEAKTGSPDSREAIDENEARRSSTQFAAGLGALWMILDPNPVGWVEKNYRPDAYPDRTLPRVRDVFTIDGLRTLADHLSDIADHLESKGATL